MIVAVAGLAAENVALVLEGVEGHHCARRTATTTAAFVEEVAVLLQLASAAVTRQQLITAIAAAAAIGIEEAGSGAFSEGQYHRVAPAVDCCLLCLVGSVV